MEVLASIPIGENLIMLFQILILNIMKFIMLLKDFLQYKILMTEMICY